MSFTGSLMVRIYRDTLHLALEGRLETELLQSLGQAVSGSDQQHLVMLS